MNTIKMKAKGGQRWAYKNPWRNDMREGFICEVLKGYPHYIEYKVVQIGPASPYSIGEIINYGSSSFDENKYFTYLAGQDAPENRA